MPAKPVPSLVRHVRAVSRLAAALVAAILVVTAVGGTLLVRSHAETERLIDAARHARLAHNAMLDQQTAVRGFLLTGASRFLDPVADAERRLAATDEALAPLVAGDPHLVDLLVEARVAAEQWMAFVEPVTVDHRTFGPTDRLEFLDDDERLFGAFRDADIRFVDALTSRRDAVLAAERVLLSACLAAQGALLAGVALAFGAHRRRLVTQVVEPVGELRDVIGRLTAGELGARASGRGYEELRSTGVGLAVLADTLVDEQSRAQLRADLLAAKADDLRELLRTSREISGNLSVRYVVDAVTTAARRLTGWPTARVVIVADGEDVPDALAPVVATAMPVVEPGRAAFPMVVGGAVVGVLECRPDDDAVASPQAVEVLTLLAAQAAASVEAARLGSQLARDSRVDALTGLPNRRSLDEDLGHELDRTRRYGRPLSVLMVDLDHFKAVNDDHGHAAGDAALRSVAETIAGELRSTDTAYRYGGEELTVLLRETAIDAAADVAERLRARIQRRGAAGIDVTASVGVVELQPSEAAEELLAAADAALYRAKREGRNRVVADARGAAHGGAVLAIG